MWGTTQSLWGILSHIIHFSHMSNWMNVDVPKAISRNSVSFTMVYWALTSKTSQFRTFEPNPITLWKIIENMSIKNCNDSIIYQIPLSIKTRIKSSYILIAIPLCVMLLHILQVIFIDWIFYLIHRNIRCNICWLIYYIHTLTFIIWLCKYLYLHYCNIFHIYI